MFNGKNAEIILKMNDNIFAVGTDGDGLHVYDMECSVDKFHLFKTINIRCMTSLGNG